MTDLHTYSLLYSTADGAHVHVCIVHGLRSVPLSLSAELHFPARQFRRVLAGLGRLVGQAG